MLPWLRRVRLFARKTHCVPDARSRGGLAGGGRAVRARCADGTGAAGIPAAAAVPNAAAAVSAAGLPRAAVPPAAAPATGAAAVPRAAGSAAVPAGADGSTAGHVRRGGAVGAAQRVRPPLPRLLPGEPARDIREAADGLRTRRLARARLPAGP